MSNYKAIREIIRKMSGQENVFTVPKIYVEFTGDITTAILLNQIVFLSDKSKRKDGFFYKTYKEWKEEICLTERQVRYSANKLKKIGVIETKLLKANGAPTVHYKLNYDFLLDSIITKCQNGFLQNVRMENDKVSETLTEITTETTTEKEEEEEINAHAFFENNISRLSPIVIQEISNWINDMTEPVVLEAMKETALNGGRSFNYTKKVLLDWSANGVEDQNSLNALLERRKNSSKPKQNKKSKSVDWSKA